MKLEEFVQNDENLAKFENCQTQEDLDALLTAEGVEIDPANDIGELGEDDLENVAGGMLMPQRNLVSWLVQHLIDILRNSSGLTPMRPPFGRGTKAVVDWYNKNKNKIRIAIR